MQGVIGAFGKLDDGSLLSPNYGLVMSIITNPVSQRNIAGAATELTDVYAGDDTIRSRTMPCASFCMKGVVRSLPVPPDALE